MAGNGAAVIQTIFTGAVLWGLSYYAQKRGWIFTRRIEESKLLADRIKTVETQNEQLRAKIDQMHEHHGARVDQLNELIQKLRMEIISAAMEHIGAIEVKDPELHRLLTYSAEDINRFEEEKERQQQIGK